MTAELQLSAPSDERELARYGAIASRSLLFPTERVPVFLKRISAANVRVVRVGAEVAGGLAVLPMGHWFGGRVVPCWGIAAVAVAPEHRSRGLASGMLRAVLGESCREGVAISSLYPATFPLYRSAGYETAGSRMVHRIAIGSLGRGGTDADLRAALGPEDLAAMRNLYETRARGLNGAVDRAEYFWQRVLDPVAEEARAYIVSGEHGAEGYFVVSHGPPGAPTTEVTVRDAVVSSVAAGRRLVRFLADHASVVRAILLTTGPGDPLFLLAREEKLEVADLRRWMLRIVDVRASLEQRGWPPVVQGELSFELRDALLRENARTWTLEVAGGRAQVRPAREGRKPSIVLDVRGLAALYTGFLSAEELRAAGLCDGEETELATATALFAGPAPWAADYF